MTVGWWVGAGGTGTCRCKQTFSSFSALFVCVCVQKLKPRRVSDLRTVRLPVGGMDLLQP